MVRNWIKNALIAGGLVGILAADEAKSIPELFDNSVIRTTLIPQNFYDIEQIAMVDTTYCVISKGPYKSYIQSIYFFGKDELNRSATGEYEQNLDLRVFVSPELRYLVSSDSLYSSYVRDSRAAQEFMDGNNQFSERFQGFNFTPYEFRIAIEGYSNVEEFFSDENGALSSLEEGIQAAIRSAILNNLRIWESDLNIDEKRKKDFEAIIVVPRCIETSGKSLNYVFDVYMIGVPNH